MDGYITCQDCGELVFYDDGKYFCTKCNRKIKPKPVVGWGNKNEGESKWKIFQRSFISEKTEN